MGAHGIAATLDGNPADLTVARARAGDIGAFEELYRSHAGRVYALCLRMSADPARAEDQTQETFVRAWQKLDSFRGESGFPAWLTTVALNVVRSDWRSSGRKRELERTALSPPDAPAATADGRGLDLERAIGGLPGRARAVFVLHDVEGYRHEEIAGMLDVSVGTSKSQLHRARKLLREALNR